MILKVLKIFCFLSTPRYWTPTVLMISPHMYHNIPHGTQISKDGIPPRYWTPPRYSWYPHGTQDNPHGTHDSPRYWTPPTVLMISPTVLHTHYTGCFYGGFMVKLAWRLSGNLVCHVSSMKTPDNLQTYFTTELYKKYHSSHCLHTISILTN